jgi:hypothetical protein
LCVIDSVLLFFSCFPPVSLNGLGESVDLVSSNGHCLDVDKQHSGPSSSLGAFECFEAPPTPLTFDLNCSIRDRRLYVTAFDGERVFENHFFSHQNIAVLTNQKYFTRTDKLLPFQQMHSFVMLNGGVVGNWICIDRCVAHQSPTADYPNGRPCVVVRLMLTVCANPHMTMLICYTDMDLPAEIDMAFRFVKLREFVLTVSVMSFIYAVFVGEEKGPSFQTDFRLFPSEKYDIKLYDSLFKTWLALTKREYNPEHKIKFNLSKEVLKKRLSPEELKVQHPEVVLKPQEADDEKALWLANKTTDLKGACKFFLLPYCLNFLLCYLCSDSCSRGGGQPGYEENRSDCGGSVSSKREEAAGEAFQLCESN